MVAIALRSFILNNSFSFDGLIITPLFWVVKPFLKF
jgi:hypothetical protein